MEGVAVGGDGIVLVGSGVFVACGPHEFGCDALTSCCSLFTKISVVLGPEMVVVLKKTSLLATAVPVPACSVPYTRQVKSMASSL
jgi:hypothetical protein